ncbi:hypothetical protein GWI33_002067 [Rhynchophorus ferrugineus]|uniref:Putative zinc-finger domain-containing protein n=1 Tax=Rhynchophorus ferrugineus TaxID=354439 RepID=A0A834MKE9_RHYFE|nr:hypothetical protein GWI33_002067 [Rhynchophorus ferrugineus]
MQPPEGKRMVHDEGPEEGEIVSDDLEDISDDSTFFTPTNASQIKMNYLYQLCENDVKAPIGDIRDIERDSLASDSDQNSINLVKESNSMVGIYSDSDNPPAIEPCISSSPSAIEPNKDDDHDIELRQLRIEALQTAINNKFGKRKNKKKDENKENSVNNGGVDEPACPLKTEVCVEKFSSAKGKDVSKDPVSPEEDDEDVLRALLLASMSKKITKTKTQPIQVKVPPENTENKATLTQVRSSNVTLSNFKVNNVQKPVIPIVSTVKPLIIHVDSDSSDTDCQENIVKALNKPQNGEKQSSQIENSVDKFLKEQRAKVELQAKVQTKPIKTNGAIPKQTPKTTLNKSTLECLPEEKQKEYRNLLLMIRKAELKRPRLRKTSVRGNEANKPIVTTSKTTFNKLSTVSTIATAKLRQNKAKFLANRPLGGGIVGTQSLPGRNELVKSPPKLDDKTSTPLLQKTLKEVQFSLQDGRLQVEEKYKLLRPLIKKIHDLTKEQKRSNQEIKNILEQLTKARRLQQEGQKNLTNCIKELVAKKQRIDRGVVQRVTSTPIKGPITKKVAPARASSSAVSITPAVNVACNIQPIKSELRPQPKAIPSEKQETQPTAKETTQSSSRYVSPLDSQSKPQNLDPYTEMCPYEVNGTCKDTDCTYNHLR